MIEGTTQRTRTGGLRVRIDGIDLDPAWSQSFINHSPDGFAWGYGGSGPAQLALAILLHYTHDHSWSLTYYQRFKQEVIAQLSADEPFQLSPTTVEKWIGANWYKGRFYDAAHQMGGSR